MSKREEINLEQAEKVVGGAYVTSDMTLGEIIGTNRNLAKYLIDAGIPVAGNKKMMNESLSEIASVRGIDASVLENAMNEYLGGK